MTRRMAYILLLIFSSRACPAQSPSDKAIAAATAFMNGVIGDSAVDRLMNLCSLPFCHDDSIIVLTRAELRTSLSQLLTAAARDRSANHPRVDSAYVLDIRKEALFSMVPINIYFTVINLKFTMRGQEASRLIILAVQLTDEARIVGIED